MKIKISKITFLSCLLGGWGMYNIFKNMTLVDKIIQIIFVSIIIDLFLFCLLFFYAKSSLYSVSIVMNPLIGVLGVILFVLLYLRFDKYKNLFMLIIFIEIPSFLFFVFLLEYEYFLIFSFFSIIFLLMSYPYSSSDYLENSEGKDNDNVSETYYNYVNIFISCFAIIQTLGLSIILSPLRNDYKYISSLVLFNIGFVIIGSVIFILVMYKYPFKEKMLDEDRIYIRNFLILFCLVILGSEIALIYSEVFFKDTLGMIILAPYIALISLFLYMVKRLNKRFNYSQVLYQASYSILYLGIACYIWGSYHLSVNTEEQMFWLSILIYIIYFLLTLEKNINNITIKPTRASILVFFIGINTFMMILFTYFETMAEIFFGPSV